MKIFRRLLCVIMLFAVIRFNTNAQLYKIDLDEKVNKSSLIVEGKVIAKKSFWNDAHTMIFTSNTVEVYKIFKGNLEGNTIEVVTQGGAVGTRAVVVSDLLQLDEGKTGILFCQPNQENLKSPISKKMLFDIYSSDQGFLRYDEKNDIAFAPFSSYSGIEKNVYTLIQRKTGKPVSIINKNYKPGIAGISNVVSGTLAVSIGSFSPATVHGGALNDPANNLLTINGSGFGANPSGLCAVRFKDGNSDNTDPDYSVPYTSSYIVSWSNTKIVIKVPGRAATGKIAVIISDGSIAESDQELDVLYSVLNAEFDFSSLGFDTLSSTEPRLMNVNSTGGYTLQYSTSTAGSGKNLNSSPEKVTFQRALTTWKEQAGLNFTEGATTTEQSVTDDGINAIMFDNNNTGVPHLASGVLATTYGWFSVCFTSSPFKIFNAQKTGFDMVIRNNGVSSGTTAFLNGPCFPSSEIDLEMVVLHELGHALNLAHINADLESSNGNNAIFINPSKLMHYAITNYVNRRSLDISSYMGSLYTIAKQNNTYGSCGLATAEMTPLNYIVIDNDNCPATFPATPTPDGTIVNLDLVHATSNKFSDPQFTAINCGVNNGQFVTNNAFYAFRTSSSATSLRLSINNYTNTPAEQNACIGQGVRLAVYDVSTCPEGQNYPAPIACRTFLANGNLEDITNLQSNHTYLLYFDGLRNTKVKFDAVINGDGTEPPPTGNFVIKFYPNPVKNNLNIGITDTAARKYQFVLYDMLGKTIVTKSIDIIIGSQTLTLPMINVAKGMYILKVIDGKGNTIAKQKIMKG